MSTYVYMAFGALPYTGRQYALGLYIGAASGAEVSRGAVYRGASWLGSSLPNGDGPELAIVCQNRGPYMMVQSIRGVPLYISPTLGTDTWANSFGFGLLGFGFLGCCGWL